MKVDDELNGLVMRGAEARSYKGSVRGRRSSRQVPAGQAYHGEGRLGLTLSIGGRDATIDPHICPAGDHLSLFDLQFGDPYTIHARVTPSLHVCPFLHGMYQQDCRCRSVK
jgi:hypothetical protein